MADDSNVIIIKKAHRGSCIVIWGRNDYLMEAEKQLRDKKVYQKVSNSENILSTLAEMSNRLFSSLKTSYITEKQLKYFSYEYKKATNFGKLYFFPKIQKRLPHPTRVSLRIKFKLLFLKPKNYSLWCGLDILTIFFLSGYVVSKNFKPFYVVLMSFILISNLHMSQAKKALHFLTLKLVLKTVSLL